jgi:poly(3-hydroxybutyrate) depolymerase
LLKNPNVDKDNIFIFSMSGGTSLCMELMATAPNLWQGIAIDKPGEMGIDKRFEKRNLPPLLLLTGDQDPALPSIKKFQSWASTNGVNVECVYYTNSAHVTFGLNERKNSQHQVAQFFLNHLK